MRGVRYTFTVEGGRRHPLYITDDVDGGRAQRSDAARARETVYAGEVDGQGVAGNKLDGNMLKLSRQKRLDTQRLCILTFLSVDSLVCIYISFVRLLMTPNWIVIG